MHSAETHHAKINVAGSVPNRFVTLFGQTMSQLKFYSYSMLYLRIYNYVNIYFFYFSFSLALIVLFDYSSLVLKHK